MSDRTLFKLGQVVATPGALDAMEYVEALPKKLLRRHVTGDWGNLCQEDRDENDFSVKHGFRILSAYKLDTDMPIWIITEADRSVTTLLLPSEY